MAELTENIVQPSPGLKAFMEGYALGLINAERKRAGLKELDMSRWYHDWLWKQLAPAVKELSHHD